MLEHCIAVYNTMRKDFTTMESCHRKKYLELCENNRNVTESMFCILRKHEPGSAYFSQTDPANVFLSPHPPCVNAEV